VNRINAVVLAFSDLQQAGYTLKSKLLSFQRSANASRISQQYERTETE